MTTQEIAELHMRYVMPTYAPELALVRGRGASVWDAEGKRYLDFLAGIAVNSVGHAHPRVLRALRKQASRLIQVSNLYYNEEQPRLAEALSQRSLGGKCFFCNSGAEANEALIKLARLAGKPRGRYEIISFTHSFHGRTLATLTATGQEKVQKGFEPLPEGFRHAVFNDAESVKAEITERTAAILVEPVQGEGGVRPADPAFMTALRELCSEHDLLLFCDEVQSGLGRTGRWFGYQRYDIEPDAISLAKGLGGGFPIGAIVANEKLSDVFQPGHHATTFGGTPLACAVARAVIETIDQEGLLENAEARGHSFRSRLEKLKARNHFIEEVRGVGLMIGLVLDRPAKPLERLLRQQGVLALATAENVLRFLPPLNVKEREIKRAVKRLGKACAAWRAVNLEEPT